MKYINSIYGLKNIRKVEITIYILMFDKTKKKKHYLPWLNDFAKKFDKYKTHKSIIIEFVLFFFSLSYL